MKNDTVLFGAVILKIIKNDFKGMEAEFKYLNDYYFSSVSAKMILQNISNI